MLASLIVMTAVMGQTYIYPARHVPKPTPAQQAQQAKALEDLRARRSEIEAKLVEEYQLQNLVLIDRTETYNQATNLVNAITTSGAYYTTDDQGRLGFRSLAPRQDGAKVQDAPTLAELKRDNLLLKAHLRNVRDLHGLSRKLYVSEYPMRMMRGRDR